MKSLKILALALIPLAAVVPIGQYAVSFYNDCIVREKNLVAAWKESQLEYDNLWKSVQETANVTDAHQDAFRDIFKIGMRARYPKDGHMVSWLRESNPELPTALYGKVLTIVEQGRDKVTASQTEVNEQQRDYDIAISTFPDSLFASVLGFPRAVEGEYAPSQDFDGDGTITVLDYRILSSDRTEGTFETARENTAMQPFK